MDNNTQKQNEFFDLHTTGIGYLNRLRVVKPKTGRPYLSVTVAALKGNVNNVQYTYFDCIVVEEEAKNVLLNFVDTDEQDAKYLISFNIGDIYTDIFTYKTGNKAGQPGVSLKGRLIKIKWLKKNNELIYKPQKTSAVAQSAQHVPSVESTQEQNGVNQTQFNEVFLSKEDPEFELKKERLEKIGYCFSSERNSWVAPQASVAA